MGRTRLTFGGIWIGFAALLVSATGHAEWSEKPREPRRTLAGDLYRDVNEFEDNVQAQIEAQPPPYNPHSKNGRYEPPDAWRFPPAPPKPHHAANITPYVRATAPYAMYRLASMLGQYQDPPKGQRSKRVMYEGAQYCFARSPEMTSNAGVEPIEGHESSPLAAVFVVGDRPSFGRGPLNSTEQKIHLKLVFNDATATQPGSIMDLTITSANVRNLTGHSIDLYPHLKGKLGEDQLLPEVNPPNPKAVWLQGLYDNPAYRLGERDHDYIQNGQAAGGYSQTDDACKAWSEPHHRLNANGVRQLTAILLGRLTPDGKAREGGFTLELGSGALATDRSMPRIFAHAQEPDHNDEGVVGWPEALKAFTEARQVAVKTAGSH